MRQKKRAKTLIKRKNIRRNYKTSLDAYRTNVEPTRALSIRTSKSSKATWATKILLMRSLSNPILIDKQRRRQLVKRPKEFALKKRRRTTTIAEKNFSNNIRVEYRQVKTVQTPSLVCQKCKSGNHPKKSSLTLTKQKRNLDKFLKIARMNTSCLLANLRNCLTFSVYWRSKICSSFSKAKKMSSSLNRKELSRLKTLLKWSEISMASCNLNSKLKTEWLRLWERKTNFHKLSTLAATKCSATASMPS